MNSRQRQNRGTVMLELVASLSLTLPLIFLIIFAVLELSYAFFLKSSLSHAARQAARELSISYGQNPQVATDNSMQKTVLNDVRIPNVVNANEQFETPVFSTAGNLRTVTVKVNYTSGKNGLPVFPNVDPLGLLASYPISDQATYRLE